MHDFQNKGNVEPPSLTFKTFMFVYAPPGPEHPSMSFLRSPNTILKSEDTNCATEAFEWHATFILRVTYHIPVSFPQTPRAFSDEGATACAREKVRGVSVHSCLDIVKCCQHAEILTPVFYLTNSFEPVHLFWGGWADGGGAGARTKQGQDYLPKIWHAGPEWSPHVLVRQHW